MRDESLTDPGLCKGSSEGLKTPKRGEENGNQTFHATSLNPGLWISGWREQREKETERGKEEGGGLKGLMHS